MNNPEDILQMELRRDKVKELLEYLTKHAQHGDRNTNHLAWNIKTHAADYSLKDPKLREEYGLKGKWNRRWEKELEENDDLIGNCCEDGLDFVGDTQGKNRRPFSPWTTKEGDEFDYEIWSAGRSGGWLELHTFEGAKVSLSDLEEIYEALCETEADYCCRECEGHFVDVPGESRYGGRSTVRKWVRDKCHDPEEHAQKYYGEVEERLGGEEWLEKLVRFCRSLDGFDASKELEHQLAYRRGEMEEEWEEEAKQGRTEHEVAEWEREST